MPSEAQPDQTRAVARLLAELCSAIANAPDADLVELRKYGTNLPHVVADFIHSHVDFIEVMGPSSPDDLDAAYVRLASAVLIIVR